MRASLRLPLISAAAVALFASASQALGQRQPSARYCPGEAGQGRYPPGCPQPRRPAATPSGTAQRPHEGRTPVRGSRPPIPDAAEQAYQAGHRLWDQRRFAEAQASLQAAATRYPTGRWNGWIRYLLGRAYLDDGKPATAAQILLANYRDNPWSERAPDSLLYLGRALTRLGHGTEACRVYDELLRAYPDVGEPIRREIPAARRAAGCST